jgi:hypothetical protein
MKARDMKQRYQELSRKQGENSENSLRLNGNRMQMN